MAIDAKIELVTYETDGTVTLHLGTRDGQTSPGQTSLTVVNPKPGMEVLEGECIWGGSGFIMYRDRKWATREGYTAIRLLDQQPTGPDSLGPSKDLVEHLWKRTP
jgi:hypothetical protein